MNGQSWSFYLKMMADAPSYKPAKSKEATDAGKTVKRQTDLFPSDGSDFASNLKRIFGE